jgi:hypothetical protein
MKITDEGFIWKVITPTQALYIFKHMPVYRLYEDGSESLIETKEEINFDRVYGLEVGFISKEDKIKILSNSIIY